MPQPLFDKTEVGVIHFTRRIASQCSRPGAGIPDWVVCDTVANGARRRVGQPGPRGGAIFRFEKTYWGSAVQAAVTVRVLAKVTRRGCFALQILLPSAWPKTMPEKPGFLLPDDAGGGRFGRRRSLFA